MPVSRLLRRNPRQFCWFYSYVYIMGFGHGYMPAAGREKSMFPHYSEHKDKDTDVKSRYTIP
jgi:hypothetical protein